MELECTKLGNTKSISLNSRYNIIDESATRYTLVNDRGVQANYSKNLFRVVTEEQPIIEVQEIEVINELNIETNCNELLIFTIKCKINNELSFEYTSTPTFQVARTSFSCGIIGIDGLNNFANKIFTAKVNFLRFIEENKENFTLNPEINIEELFQDITKSLIQDIIANFQGDGVSRAGLLIMSTTTDCSDFLKNALNELATTSTTAFNPNSGNNIIMWSFIVNEELSQDELDELNGNEDEEEDWDNSEDEEEDEY